MGINNDGFKKALNSKIHVDKSGMIEITYGDNKVHTCKIEKMTKP